MEMNFLKGIWGKIEGGNSGSNLPAENRAPSSTSGGEAWYTKFGKRVRNFFPALDDFLLLFICLFFSLVFLKKSLTIALCDLTNRVSETEMKASSFDSLFKFLEKNQWISISLVVFCFGFALLCFRMYDRAVLKQHLKYIEIAIAFNRSSDHDFFVSKVKMSQTGASFHFSIRPKKEGSSKPVNPEQGPRIS